MWRMTPHKENYLRSGKEISKYNRKYYQDHKEKILERANRRLVVDPNINKRYYSKHKKGGSLNAKT